MNNKESLYIKILLWAYEKSTDGFTENELFENFQLDRLGLRGWYLKVFRESSSLIIDNFKNVSDVSYWCLTARGMSNAVNYLELKETQKSGKRGEHIALWAIGVSIVVGLVQIFFAFYSSGLISK